MSLSLRPGCGAGACFALITLLLSANHALAADDVWQSTFGQSWFYEVRDQSGEVLAGTWWEQSLSPGTTYTIRFNVKNLRGKVGLLVGNNGAVTIDRTGTYTYDFSITESGKRRMIFRTLTSNVMASVNQISVTPKWSGGQTWSGNWIPRGHYLSFDRERNLQTDMQSLVDQPWTADSNHRLNVARDLHDALQTPGVKGVWMAFNWRSVEFADGAYRWGVLDANMDVAREHGLKFIVEIADRSFDGTNVLPGYFPSQYVLWSSGGGKSGVVSKRWDPYVYGRLIRLHKAIASRYANHPGFGGIATAETAMGKFSAWDYSIWKYRAALKKIVTETQAALTSGKLFFYLNFLKGGDSSDMNRDHRVDLLREVPTGSLVVGAPDVTPDLKGMPRSATAYRVHVRKTMPSVNQFCHFQHVDQGLGGLNVRTNKYRQEYLDEVARVRERESQWWFTGEPAVFEFDDLRDPKGNRVKLHPSWVVGQLWNPRELFAFGRRNFDCDYVFWHYREFPKWNEFGWEDIRPVIVNNPSL